MDEAEHVVEGPAAFGPEFLHQRVHQIQPGNLPENAAQHAKLRSHVQVHGGGRLIGEELHYPAPVNPTVLGVHGYFLAVRHLGHDLRHPDQTRNPQLSAERGHMAGGAAHLGDNGRGPVHDLDELGGIAVADEHRALGKVLEIGQGFHPKGRTGADALLGHPSGIHRDKLIAFELFGKLWFVSFALRDQQGSGLQDVEDTLRVHGPFDILGPLEKGFQMKGDSGKLKQGLLVKAGSLALAVGHRLHGQTAGRAIGGQQGFMFCGDHPLHDLRYLSLADSEKIRGHLSLDPRLPLSQSADYYHALRAGLHGINGIDDTAGSGHNHPLTAGGNGHGAAFGKDLPAVMDGLGAEKTGRHLEVGAIHRLGPGRNLQLGMKLPGKGKIHVLFLGAAADCEKKGEFAAACKTRERFSQRLKQAGGRLGAEHLFLQSPAQHFQLVFVDARFGQRLLKTVELRPQAVQIQQIVEQPGGDDKSFRHPNLGVVEQFGQMRGLAAHQGPMPGLDLRKPEQGRAFPVVPLVEDRPDPGLHGNKHLMQRSALVLGQDVDCGNGAMHGRDHLLHRGFHIAQIKKIFAAQLLPHVGDDLKGLVVCLEHLAELGEYQGQRPTGLGREPALDGKTFQEITEGHMLRS